jgi:RimJ/RimL family protein N-acetyltransferase
MVLIERWSDDDLGLLQGLNGDPAMMAHVGGPETAAKIAERHGRYRADPQQFRILHEGAAVGWVGYWEREWRDEQVYEIGWSVLPGFQGRGLAGGATAAALDHARGYGHLRFLHAFPSVDNDPSNALCRSVGFALLGAVEFEYPPGNRMRCNDWRVDLRG